MNTSVSEPPIWKPKLPPSTRIEPGADQPTPPSRRQLTNPFPYLAPTMKAPFFRPGTMMMHWALPSRSCGIDLSGMPITSFRDSAAASRRSGASAADNNPAPSVTTAIHLSFIGFPPSSIDSLLHDRTESQINVWTGLDAFWLRLVPFHHAGYLGLAHPVDPADDAADLGGYALRFFFWIDIEFDF